MGPARNLLSSLKSPWMAYATYKRMFEYTFHLVRNNDLSFSYDRTLIRAIVVAAYIGWAAYASLFIFRPQQPDLAHHTRLVTFAATSILSAFCALFAIQRSPWTYYLYIAFPVYFWHQFLVNAFWPLRMWVSSGGSRLNYRKTVLSACLIFMTLQAMVVRIRLMPVLLFSD
jgi:phosphatidylinositol glycan class N